MRAALATSQTRADEGDLIAALAASTTCTGRLRRDRESRVRTGAGSIGPRFDRILYLWYTESIVDVGRSYRSDLVAALERGERDEAVAIMRAAWTRFRGVVTARDDGSEA